MERKPDIVRIDDFGVARPTDRGAVQRFKSAKGIYRLLPSPPRFVLLERHVEGADPLRLRIGGEISAPGMLCDIGALIAQAGWRGELVVWSLIGASESAARSIFFEAGNVLGAQSTAPGERLGELMYKLGVLDREQILAVTKSSTPERRFGETAVDLGFIPRDRLFDLVRAQTEEIFYAAMRCAEGTFWFVDGFESERLAYRHRVSAQTLLMEGVRRMDEAKYFHSRIPSAAHVPARLPIRIEPPDELDSVFDACDGKRTIMDIGRVAGLGEFETMHAVFRLVQGGFVQITAPRPNTPEASVEIFNAAIRPILSTADQARRGSEVRAHLAAFASGIGVYDALFLGAGPGADGSVDPSRVARNVIAMAGDDPNAALGQWLHDYLSFALFDASTEMPKNLSVELTRGVGDLIAQLAPKTGPSSVVPPAQTRPRSTVSTRSARPGAPASPPPPSPPPSLTPPPRDAFENVPAPPFAQLPALAPMPTPAPDTRPSLGVDRPLPPARPPGAPPARPGATPARPGATPARPGATPARPGATQMQLAPLPAIFDDPTRDPMPMPAPLFATLQTDAGSDAARARNVSRKRSMRTALLVLAMLLLAGGAAGALVVTGVVKLKNSEPPVTVVDQPKPKRPKAEATAEPSVTAVATPIPPIPPVVSVSASAAPTQSEIPGAMGRLVLKAPAGFRVFVDGKVVGSTPDPVLVVCGSRAIKIGSHGTTQQISVPCGGEIDVYAK